MEIAAKQSAITQSFTANESLTLSEKFTEFCKGLESYRLLLLSLFLMIQGCIFVPATLLVSSFIDMGLGEVSVGVVVAGTVGVLVSNMSEASIKVVISTFILSSISSIVLLAIHLLS